MAVIFLSYASNDRKRVAPLARALEDHGWTVWWDSKIPPGQPYEEVIADQLQSADAVVCVWTRVSVTSRWVRNEARVGLRRNVLVPVSLEQVNLPLAFADIEFVDLAGWTRGREHDGFDRLVESLEQQIGEPRIDRQEIIPEPAQEVEVPEEIIPSLTDLREETEPKGQVQVQPELAGDSAVQIVVFAMRSPLDDAGAPPYLELRFIVDGISRPADHETHRVERRRLERILNSTVGDEQPARSVHTMLFDMLLPDELKSDLMAAQQIALVVDGVTAELPWEMLASRDQDDRPSELVLRAELTRQIAFEGSLPSVRRAAEPTALVIGNPPVGEMGPSLLSALAQAQGVADVLREHEYVVVDRCFADEQADDRTTLGIETALFDRDYRIIHFAGHGALEPDDPTRTGMAIGPDSFITASALETLGAIPDIAFISCGHRAVVLDAGDGATIFARRDINQLGARLAHEMIGLGVRAVVVAGWTADDLAGTAFAAVFYDQMLGGATFGTAVYLARFGAREAAPYASTWGAYQCYGELGYRLPRD